MTNPIKLTDIIPISNPEQYKLHLASRNPDGVHPLDEYVADRKNWVAWNEWKGDKNDWTRPRIFSFLEFYPRSCAYLFGGIFEVKQRLSDRYELLEISEYDKWEGRLVCRFSRYQGLRGRAFKLENQLASFDVLEILPEKYEGERFPGYEYVNHGFAALKGIITKERPDWKASLLAVKGVYLIFDTKNGKSYVGSAYGDAGIWSRLNCYVYTGHGWNDELMKTIQEKGADYSLQSFKFSILEVFAFNTPDDVIISRESHWKEVLRSREFGYNKN